MNQTNINLGQTHKLARLFQLIILSLPLLGYSIFNIGNRGIRADWLLITLLIVIMLPFLKFDRLSLMVVLLNAAVFMSAYNPIMSADTSRLTDFVSTWMQFALCTMMFLSVIHLRFGEQDMQLFLKCFLFIGIVTAALATLQLLVSAVGIDLTLTITNPGKVQPHSGYKEITGKLSRATAFFSEPRHLGVFLVSKLNIALLLLLNRGQVIYKNRLTLAAIFLLLCGGVVSSLSSSTFGIAAVSFLLIIIFLQDSLKRMVLISASIVVLFVTLWFAFEGTHFSRVLTQRFAFVDRVQKISTLLEKRKTRKIDVVRYVNNVIFAYETWQKAPFLGVGLNNMQHFNSGNYSTGAHPPFSWLAETGLAGMLTLIAFVLFLVTRFIRLMKRVSEAADHIWAKIGLLLVIQPFIFSFGGLYGYSSTFLWVELALGCIIYNYVKGTKSPLVAGESGVIK